MRRQIEQAGRKLGRPRKHATNRERVAAQRRKAKEKKLRLLADQFRLRVQDANEGNWDEEGGRSCAENSIRLCTDLGTQALTATLFSSILSPIPLGYVSGDIDAFVEFLHLCHDGHQPKSKNDSYLFSPAIFDPNKSTEESRGKENILYLRHIVLDFENGELQSETLPNLFPDLQMVVTNTYRHTHDKPRFRAVLFTDEPMSPETYDLIYNFVADKLVEAGYSVERPRKKSKASKASNSRPSGLDWGRSDPTSIFYFPCQARCADDSFFIEKIKGRYPLNPSTWIKHVNVPLQPALEPVESDTEENGVDWKRVQLAIDTWRTSKRQPGKGNDMFFDLAFSLKCAGKNFQEIEETRHAETHHAKDQRSGRPIYRAS